MHQVTFIADDFGRDAATNEAIIEGHLNGALTGASLMLGQPGTEHAIDLARAHPSLAVGWHMHLCDSWPTTARTWSWGNSPLVAGLLLGLDRSRVRAELDLQWNRFRASGIPCSFINSHHHMHAHPAVLRVLRTLLPHASDAWLRGFNIRTFSRHLPLRARILRFAGTRALANSGLPIRRSGSTWGLDRLFAMDAREIEIVLQRLGPGLHEFIFHPRSKDADADLKALLDPRLRGVASAGFRRLG